MAAKRMILQGDSEQQMLMVAKVKFKNSFKNVFLFPLQHTLFDKKEWPHSLDTQEMFLNVVVRRSHLMDDSINEVLYHYDQGNQVYQYCS